MKDKIILLKILVIIFFTLSIKFAYSENSSRLLVFINNQIITNIDIKK